ncbi:outer membrane lipoprotein-sorting protein [Flavivirga amylovorans]|uniref:Outer membrane lipoprotein-sorting protein n=1 Tax=Flavivirga amylovorans TaxID=870486 RepID=A0ABT8WXZ5_9FLAO|nr:outer membrane lipoprotein-sorting protein [Flavivirga amylovorans]MDO5986259.1 outer membrane lipoprotein-sorting protein [Flavivirga amylovorans]
MHLILKKSHIKLSIYSTLFALFIPVSMLAQSLPLGNDVVKRVNERNEGEHLVQDLKMTLINKKGKKQIRDTKSYRKDYDDQRKTILLYSSPSNVKGTAFMSYDYHEAMKDDDQWLYLPALRKTRRISAANRGDYFLGTDFTYEDIKLGTKMSQDDYSYTSIKEADINGHTCILVEAIPKTDKIARELGYKKVHQWIDASIWMVRQSKYWDIAGNELKSTYVKDIKRIQGIWTFQSLEAINHKNGHKTTITFGNSDYKVPVDDDLFSEESLVRGVN